MRSDDTLMSAAGSSPAGEPVAADPKPPIAPPFGSFWMGGFESACQVNACGRRCDLIAETQHDRFAREDYRALRSVGIGAARDGVRWHRVDRGWGYDFSSVTPLVEAARDADVRVVWNLCHYGWPEGLDLFSAKFVDRFARYVRAVARHIRGLTDQPLAFVPINEISFLAWGICTDCIIYPYTEGRGREVKHQLTRAAIAACEAVWEVDQQARLMHVDPIIHVVPPRERPDLAEAARAQHNTQWESWDMLAGLHEPQLGGDPRYLDIVGVNYYHANQWEHPDVRLRWEDVPIDARWAPLHDLLADVHERYGRPMVMAETSHFGAGRARWIASVSHHVAEAVRRGVPIGGVCLYPIIDRPDWDAAGHWHNSGLWDLEREADGVLRRRLNRPYAEAFDRCRRLLRRCGCT